MALATITARGLRLSARRATSIVPLASRASSPQFARRLPQNLITGASATTPAKALQLSEIFGKSAEVVVHKTHFDEVCALTPRVAAFQPTTAIEADTPIHTPQFWGFGVLDEAPAPKYSLEPLVEACGLSKPWARDDKATPSDLLLFSANAGSAAMATLGAMNDDDDEHEDVVKAQIQSLIDQAKTVAEQGLTDPLRKDICDGLAATLGLLGLGDGAQNQGRVLRLRFIPSCGNL